MVPAVGANWLTVLQVIHHHDPAAIMITQFLPSELADFQRTFVADPTDSLIYAVYSPSIPQFLDSAGPTAEGLIWSTVSGTYSDHVGARFAERYQAAYGRPPGRSHVGIAYDEVHLLAQAWATVGNPRSFRSGRLPAPARSAPRLERHLPPGPRRPVRARLPRCHARSFPSARHTSSCRFSTAGTARSNPLRMRCPSFSGRHGCPERPDAARSQLLGPAAT